MPWKHGRKQRPDLVPSGTKLVKLSYFSSTLLLFVFLDRNNTFARLVTFLPRNKIDQRDLLRFSTFNPSIYHLNWFNIEMKGVIVLNISKRTFVEFFKFQESTDRISRNDRLKRLFILRTNLKGKWNSNFKLSCLNRTKNGNNIIRRVVCTADTILVIRRN